MNGWEAVVISNENATGNSELVAYYVADGELTASELRRFLAEELPNYMIPSYWVPLQQMPLSGSGKLDRKSLPTPQADHVLIEQVYVAPKSELEQGIVAICKEVLKRDRVGIHDNFFDLGANSLEMIRINHLMQERSHWRFPL